MSAPTAGIAKMLLLIQALSGLCWVGTVKCHLDHAPRALFETSLGDNGTVTMSSSESCSKARTNIEQNLPSGAHIEGPFNVISAPELVRDSCAINTIRDGTEHGYVNFGKIDQDKFISGPGLSGGYTWSVWIKISGCRGDCLYEHIKLINFKGSDEISPFSLQIMQGRIVCSARSYDKTVQVENVGQNLWFHIVCAFKFPNSTAKAYINGNEITSQEENTDHPAVQSSGELILGYGNPELSADLGYSNLVVTDGVLSGTKIKHLYSCGSMDWSLRLRSLVNVSSSAKDPSDLMLQCTASAATGPTIAWRVYHSKCSLWRDLHNGSEAGSVRIENRNLSSCVQTSTLHLSNYHKRDYCGAVIECSASSPNSPPPKPFEFRIPEDTLPRLEHCGKCPTLTELPESTKGKFDQIFKDMGNADLDDVCDGKRFYEKKDKVITAIIPSEADPHFKVTAAVDGMEHAVHIPRIRTSLNETVIVVLTVYKSYGNASKIRFRGDSDASVEFGSHIIEVEVATQNGTTFTDFHEAPVKLTFPLSGIPINKTPICSYSSGDDSYWYADGCVVASVVGHNVTCSCNHLTHFAVLLQLKEVEENDTFLLVLLTRIGLGLSITCLTLTLLVYALCRLTSTRIVTHANLAFSIMASHLTFLFIKEDSQAGCTAVAILLHFFLLAAFTWMALEGVFLYVKSSPTLRWKIRLPIWLLTGWGCPAVVVISTVAVRFQDYTRLKICWLSFDDGLVWAILAPFLVIITGNTVMLFRLTWIFLSLKTNRDKSKAKKMKAGLRLFLILEPLLGLPWILNLFYISPSTIFFAYASVILNTLQGVFMFLSQCIFDQKQREGLRRKIRRWTSELRAVTRGN